MNLFGKDPDKKEIISPIEFVDKFQESPISFMQNDINGTKQFAILRTTAGGKFVRGNLLYYCLNGVEVYTDINNIIFVDTVNNTLFIKEYAKVINEIAPEDPEQKQYIILYTDLGYENSDEEFPLRWEAVQGRKTAYDTIKANASVIDIDKSIVLAETVAFKDSLTVREFVNYLKNSDYIDDDGFDINDFSSEYI